MTNPPHAATGGFSAASDTDEEAAAQDVAERRQAPKQTLATSQELFRACHISDV